MVNENGVFNLIGKLNGDQATHLCNCIKQPMASSWEAKNSGWPLLKGLEYEHHLLWWWKWVVIVRNS
jgi:hypothetical protein